MNTITYPILANTYDTETVSCIYRCTINDSVGHNAKFLLCHLPNFCFTDQRHHSTHRTCSFCDYKVLKVINTLAA